MVIAQWLERGLGQLLAPDEQYEEQPDHMDTRSEFWQVTAPDPQFSSQQPYPPARAFPPSQQQVECIHCHQMTPISFDTTATTPGEPNPKTPEGPAMTTTVFLSPTPAKRNPRRQSQQKSQKREQEQSEFSNSEVEEQILIASRDTFFMLQRNSKFRNQAGKLLQFCSSTGALQTKALQSMDKLLLINASRMKATDNQEPNLLTQARSLQMGVACPDGMTPLLAAVKSGQLEAAKLLLQHAGDDRPELLRQTNLFGQTPYHLAAAYGQLTMLELLQEQPQNDILSPAPPPQEQQDVTGLSAWDAMMTSPNPKARQNRQRLDELLSPTPAKQRNQKCMLYDAPSEIRAQYTTAHLDGRRVFNEDAVLCTPLVWNKASAMLFLICDGHGDCGSVAHFVAQHLPEALQIAMPSSASTNAQLKDLWANICQDAAHSVDVQLRKAHLDGGSTACWVILTPDQIVCANVGDSRCILVTNQGEIRPLSTDHKPDLPVECLRIEQAGLTVVHETYTPEDGTPEQSIAKVQLSAMNQLGTSRAFGDFEYKKLPDDADENTTLQTAVICTPDVLVMERSVNDGYLILACDGIWDVQSNQAVTDFVLSQSDWTTAGPALLQECLCSGDNLSLILVNLGTKQAAAAAKNDDMLTPKFSKLNLDDDDGAEDYDPSPTPAKALSFSPERQSQP